MTKLITRGDILPFDDYAVSRKDYKKALTEKKKNRRIEVGPHATFYFENYETMWHQIHEMLYIERGGEDQILNELAAYNPLIPQGRELIATVMFEIADPVRRANVLGSLGGIEETMFITVNAEKIAGVAEADVDRTTADGKASAVQFVHFPFTDDQTSAFAAGSAQVTVGFTHHNYVHAAGMPLTVRTAVSEDFD
ncbi:MAG: DUF3501 family protein [Pseudomonadota bacterium]|nr:DUF3501 family protein [Pseudomonadota bacterium]